MLVLSRKKGESIVIQDNIEITILDTTSDIVKVGISAPENIEILRKELVSSVKDSNRSAALQVSNIESLANSFKKYNKK